MSEIVRPLEVIETEINFYKQQTATGIIEIGKRLIEAKSQLQHGEWGNWLAEKVYFSDRTANRFMQAAREFSNPSALSNLSQTKIFMLLDVPSEERETFVQEKDVANISTRQLESEIKVMKQEQEELQKRACNAEQEAKIALDQVEEARQETKRIERLRQSRENAIEAHQIALAAERGKTESLKTEIFKLQQTKAVEVEKEVIKEIEKIVVPGDYEQVKGKFATLTQQLQSKEFKIKQLEDEKLSLERKAQNSEKEAGEYQELKKKIEFMQREKSDLSRQIESATEFAGLTVELDKILKEKLAPIKYSRIMDRLDSEVAVKNLTEIIEKVEMWCDEMRIILSSNDVINVEVYK